MADAFTDYTMQQFIAHREILRGQFEKINSQVSLTVDGWTSPNKKSSFCITGHYIDKDWKLHDILLYAVEVTGSSGENLSDRLNKT